MISWHRLNCTSGRVLRSVLAVVLVQHGGTWHAHLASHCGWRARRFDTVYMDDKIRIAKDIRGDTLVVANDGAPKRFA